MLAAVSFVLCAVLCTVLCAFAYDGQTLFQLHPIFFGIGFLMCTITAINVMQSKLAPVAGWSRKTKGQLHGILQVVGLLFMLMGYGAIYGNKEERGKPHLTTWHAWVGIAALGWMALNVLGGLSKTINITKMRLNWIWSDKTHGLSGRLAAITGMVAVGLGLWSNWAIRNLGQQRQIALTAASVVIIAIIAQPLVARKPVKKVA